MICRQLGYTGATSTLTGVANVPTAGAPTQIWMDDLKCRSTDQSVAQCPFNGWGSHDCVASENIGVVCSGKHDIYVSSFRVISPERPLTFVALYACNYLNILSGNR